MYLCSMKEFQAFFVDVLLPLPLPGTYTYRVPAEMHHLLAVGKRVVVPFGKQKMYAALIRNIHQTAPGDYVAKYIQAVLDDYPLVNANQFQFWDWIADYYMCYPGDVMNAALPSAFKLTGETLILLNPEFDGDISSLSENEYFIVEALHQKTELSIAEIIKITGLQKCMPLVKNLQEKNVVFVQNEVNERYKHKKVTYVKLSDKYQQDEQQLKNLFEQLEKRAVKQLEVLMQYLLLSQEHSLPKIKKSLLFDKLPSHTASFHTLLKKGVFEQEEITESRLEIGYENDLCDIHLSDLQQKALNEIFQSFENHNVTLLHGVTGSGKTEIYTKLIQKALDSNQQVLYLLPEIALTSQTINRLRKVFGDKVGVYHSKYNEHERAEIWSHVAHFGTQEESADLQGKYQIILGARSSLFLPFSKLGFIIVDEEHDTSYKQMEPAPRYHARDAAIYFAGLYNAKVLLGSATPMLETYYNANSGKYGLVSISERFHGAELPEIKVVDLKKELSKKTMHEHFSSVLVEHIRQALEKKEQIILFQNRRGFSLRIECESCHYMPVCDHCDVTLTYHKHQHRLKCHYCSFSKPIPEKCPQCGNPLMLMKGFGTEKVEEDIALLFPQAKVARMDYDTTRSKNAYQQMIHDFEEHRIDILVGTQMVTKGLDFDKVSVVGILNADNMLSFPDFRAFERSFQLMEQVSGRAGRKNKQGTVIIQTYRPDHPIIKLVEQHDYQALYNTQMIERNLFKYPPFYRLIKLTLKHKDPQILNKGADKLALMLRPVFDKNILGPEYPLVSRIQQFYLKDILLKFPRDGKMMQKKQLLKNYLLEFSKISDFKSIRVVIDVDMQ